MNLTQVYETVEAEVAHLITLTSLPVASPTPQLENTTPAVSSTPTISQPTVQETQPLLPTATPNVKGICDRAAPGSPIDVTILDNTEMVPGQAFTKVWRLVNVGECKWTRNYTAEWFSGHKLGDIQVVSLNTEVATGQSVDIIVDMIAPLLPGTYQSNWKLRNPAKEWFGIGPNGDQVFWVRIVVIQVDTNTPTPTATAIPPSATPTSTFLPTLTSTSTLTPTVTPAVFIRGSAVLANGDSLDLDTTQTNTTGIDLGFQKDELRNHWFVPEGGAILGVYGAEEPSLSICLSANMSAAPIPIESLSPGAYLCYRTSQGLPGWLRYDTLNADVPSVNLVFLTWSAP